MLFFRKRKHQQTIHRPKRKWSWTRLQYLGIGFFVLLVLLLPVLKNILVPTSVKAGWFDEGYAYRQRLTFTHNAAISSARAITFSFDTAEMITANIMQSDCDDIRFTDANGKLLDFQLTGTCNNAATTYEVAFPSINNGANLGYVYYGNATAVIGSITLEGITALTPSGGDPAITTRTSEENGPGPILYWKFDEGNATTAQDSTAQNNDGNLSASPTIIPSDRCVSGMCVYFSGSPYIQMNDDTDVDFAGSESFTLETWFSHRENTVVTYLIAKYRSTTGTDGGYKLYMEADGDLTCGIDDDNASFPEDSVTSTAATYDDNRWHHVACVKNGTTSLRLYIDGQEVGTADTSISSTGTLANTDSLFMAVDGDASTGPWVGYLDEAKIYRYARSASEIKADAVRGSQSKGSSGSFVPDNAYMNDGLVGYWKLDESSGSFVDSSGNGTTLTPVNTPSLTIGHFFQSWVFTRASSQYAFAADNVYLSLTGSVSISAWYYSQQATAATQYDIAGKWDGANESYLLAQYGDEFRFYVDSASNYVETTAANISINVFSHVMASYDARLGTVRIYVNGVEQPTTTTGTIPTSIGDDAGRFHIGGEDSSTAIANAYFGALDDVRVYNRALEPREAYLLYDLAPPPVGYWNLDDGPTSSTAKDVSSNNNNLTLVNTDTTTDWVDGKFGRAYNGDNVNNFAYYASGASPTIYESQVLTATAWVYVPSSGGGAIINVNPRGADNDGRGFRLTINQAGSLVGLSIGLGTGLFSGVSGSVSIPTNTWVHVAGTYDRLTAKIYFNGVLINSTALTSPVVYADRGVGNGPTTNTFYLGATHNNNPTSNTTLADMTLFLGRIDEAKVYNYAMNQRQIIADMNAGHPLGGSPVGSQSVYWKFDEMNSTTANDTAVQAATSNGTLTNMASPATSTSGWTTSGKFNSALVFDGTDDNVAIADASDGEVNFASTESFSMGAWIYSTTVPTSTSDKDLIIGKWDETAAAEKRGYRMYLENDDTDSTGNIEVQVYDESANQAITATGTTDGIVQNTWYHVMFTFNGGVAGAAGDLKVYVDGRLQGSNTLNASFLGLEDVATDFTVGDYDASDAFAGNTAFTGRIDDVQVYSAMLTLAEVQVVMNANASSNFFTGTTLASNLSGGAGNSPVAYWNLDENTSTTANDRSGNANTGTITAGGGDTWVTGKVGAAYNFDGASTSINAGSGASLDDLPAAGMSIAAWIYPRTVGEGSAGFIMAKNVGTTPSSGWVFRISGTNALTFTVDGTTDLVHTTSASVLTLNAWNHVMLTWDGVITTASTARIYVNGLEVTYATTTNGASRVSDATSTLYIGNDSTGARTFDGYIDDVKVYNYQRSQEQVRFDFNKGGPVAWYKMDDCSGSTAYDSSGNGYNLTITPGASGNTAVGSCGSGTATEMWNNGTTGKYNASLDFDGSNDYATNATTTVFDSSAAFTMMAWIYPISYGGGGLGEIVGKTGSVHFLMNQSTSPGTGFGLLYDANGTYCVSTAGSITLSTWQHVAVVHNGSGTCTLYKDGKNVTSDSTVTDVNASAALFVGAEDATPANSFDGLLDEVRIYNYALSANQVKNAMNEGAGARFGP